MSTEIFLLYLLFYSTKLYLLFYYKILLHEREAEIV